MAKRRSKRWTVEIARQVIRDQEEAKLSVAAYCRREKIAKDRFYRWRQKLRALGESDQLAPRQKAGADDPFPFATAGTVFFGEPSEAEVVITFGDSAQLSVNKTTTVSPRWVAKVAVAIAKEVL